MSWATTDLCTDKDLQEEETSVMEWWRPRAGGKHWRDLAKNKIAEKLRQGLKDEELATDADEVLDNILNPEVLNTVAVYMSLHLLCKDKMQDSNDLYASKSAFYYREFEKEWTAAKGMLHFDTDEDGVVDDEEKYNVRTGVRLFPGP